MTKAVQNFFREYDNFVFKCVENDTKTGVSSLLLSFLFIAIVSPRLSAKIRRSYTESDNSNSDRDGCASEHAAVDSMCRHVN